jgi:hypothetical protein
MTELATYLIGSLCYGVIAAFSIRMRVHLTVAATAALAPAVAAAAVTAAGEYGPLIVAVAPVVAVIAVIASGGSVGAAGWHSLLFMLLLGLVGVSASMGLEGLILRLLLALVGTAVYISGDFIKQRWTSAVFELFRGDNKMWWLLCAVLACASGLTVLVTPTLGWPAFVAMAGVLALIRREFEAFGQSRTAYDQTLHALDRLEAFRS